MPRRYCVYDVFTNRALAGNPLAVVLDGEGLSDQAMQSIATEMNLSETVFVQPPVNPGHTARIRIFTPARELPFAGHPTVGTAVALAETTNGDRDAGVDFVSVLEENVGPVRCAVRLKRGEAGFAEFDLPRKSVRTDLPLDRQGIADALGLKASDIGFENHLPSVWSAGVPFLLVPIHDLRAAERLEFDPQYWERTVPFVDGHLASAYVYCRGGVHHSARFHARMFSPDMGISEDPATGAAVAALSGAIHHFDGLPDGHHAVLVEQGMEMGRPSYIHLHMDVEEGTIATARIGGEAVRLASGELYL
ncbi:PhzF family phenazine biosynthesis protein [Rhizobiaceae bacterium n13]|uniref:PhzF family phenazine biosynthesis protein n=1 Tax=Ferirhizobium litorale TaxID=2927786 RepID=A0AAE3QE21_9HYPH|nr:PhzF family phenazine biosynthesis protein [Fererhizobium litorale]MDI7863650.1 PhzF family phenazine biosynthesis protein [Fererhizobium litorale]MDI7923380.1 PhzF family phenazine biosynthesis protein [Fererhizobium litorale]